jgi:hypothetical protein
MDTIIRVLEVGVGMSVIFYWLGILLGKIGTNGQDLRWWLRVVVLQGIFLAAALKVFKVF